MITKSDFVKIMEKFIDKRKESDRVLNVFYDEAGVDFVNMFGSISFEDIAALAIRTAIEDTDDILDTFLWEADCDIDKFNSIVSINGKSPNIKCYGDLYDFIIKKKLY